MAEYIDRQAAIDALTERNLVVHMDSVNDGLVASCHRSAQRIIANIPAADVRPVVLCLHCKNWDTSWAPNCRKEYGHFCPMVGTVTGADWFCADGEKREES